MDTKTAYVTGGTGTIGHAVTRRFLDSGWQVFSAGHDVDVTDILALESWFEQNPSPTALVTCAGISFVGSSVESSVTDCWDSVIWTNLTGTFYAMRTALKYGCKRLVGIGSIHGCTPTSYPQRAAYSASKAGVAGLIRALAVEFASSGVLTACVAPGHMPILMRGTGLFGNKAKKGQSLLDAATAKTPSGKLTMPEEVADVIFWLCDSAPLNMTGQTLVIDGAFAQNTFPLETT